MKKIYVLLLVVFLSANLHSQILHTSATGWFEMETYYGESDSEYHNINVSGGDFLKITVHIDIYNYGCAEIYFLDSYYYDFYPSEYDISEDFELIVPNDCDIDLYLEDDAYVYIEWEEIDEPIKVEYVYDAAGNRTERMVVGLYSSSKKSLMKDSEFIAEIEKEIEEQITLERAFKVYPNPTTQHVFVTLNDEAIEDPNTRILLFDNTGRLIYQREAMNDIEQVDLSNLSHGIYILKMLYGNSSKECKIIKY